MARTNLQLPRADSWQNGEHALYLEQDTSAWDAGRGPARRMPVMGTQRSSLTTWLTGAAMLAALGLGGCTFSSGGREAYFQARTDTVMFRPGTGDVRLSVWPDDPFGSTTAVADRSLKASLTDEP
jgi:hypothetical protein